MWLKRRTKPPAKAPSGVVFSVLEVGCAHLKQEPHPASVTESCIVRGSLFREKHTKLFIRTESCPYIRSPHTESFAVRGRPFARNKTITLLSDLNDTQLWSTEEEGGIFLHYNGLRYSNKGKTRQSKSRKATDKAIHSVSFLSMRKFVQELVFSLIVRQNKSNWTFKLTWPDLTMPDNMRTLVGLFLVLATCTLAFVLKPCAVEFRAQKSCVLYSDSNGDSSIANELSKKWEREKVNERLMDSIFIYLFSMLNNRTFNYLPFTSCCSF